MDREPWRRAWHGMVWERLAGGRWWPLATPSSRNGALLLSAWNPRGRSISRTANHARDVALLRDLLRQGLHPRRVRGRAVDGSWQEEGWMVRHDALRSLALVRRHRQLAALVMRRDLRWLLWCDGAVQRWR